MRKRSNLIVIIGVAVFVIGAGATFLVVRSGNDGGKGDKTAGAAQSSVLYAAKDIPSGITGAQAVEAGYVKTRSVAASARPGGAITDQSELAGMKAVANVPAGTLLTENQFAAPQTTLGAVKIPDGKMALAVSLGPAPGVAGFAAAGDRIDIFGVLKEGPGSPSAKLIMQNTEVLSVNPSGATAVAAAAAAASAAAPTFLLAVTAQEAERLVFYTSFNALYFSLVSKDAPTVGSTPGSSAADALKQLS